VTTTTTRTSPGLAKGKNKPDRALSAAEPALLDWDGRLFRSPSDFRRHLTAKGIQWNAFLNTHPGVVKKFALPSVQWEDRQFFTRAALSAWLTKHGTSLAAWGARHPAAFARIG